MSDIIQFGLLGLGLGAMFALAAQGVVLIYRGSGVLNFAHGAVGMVGAYVFWELRTNHGLSSVTATLAGVAVAGGLGAATHLFVMRPLRRASALVRLVATLGLLILLQSAAVLRYGSNFYVVPSILPTTRLEPFSGVSLTLDRLLLAVIALVITVVLYAVYRFTRFGLGTTAVAENQLAAATLGWSADLVAACNWALGSALAGLSAILIIPIIGLQVQALTTLVLASLAVALVAGFSSFPITLLAGIAMGVLQSELTRFTPDILGLPQSVPFLVIIGVLAVRGRSLPLRDYLQERLPALGSGRVRPLAVVSFGVITAVLLFALPVTWTDSITMTLIVSIILLSIVVLTGYAGQVSLGQFAIAGIGAYIAGRLVAQQHWPFEAALVVGVLGAVPVGMLFALPAVRARGVNLAIITLGLGTAVELMLFKNSKYTGGAEGTTVGKQTFLGFKIDAATHPERYGLLVLVFFILAALATANLRRGRAGRRLIAVRTNERAAAALGISVWGAKLYAFGLSAAIASLGGILIGFRSESIVYTDYTNFLSITYVGLTVIGGVGFVLGPVFGATLASGSIGAQIGDTLLSGVSDYMPLISGCFLVLMLLQNQDGIAKETGRQARWAQERLSRRTRPPQVAPALPASGEPTVRPAGAVLEARNLTVKFGGVTAVHDASFRLAAGQIVGLIGPNGAGKTTLIDAVTGFVKTASGTITLDGRPIEGWPVQRRARAGVSRSFQSLELFSDLTVLDNLRAASDSRDGLAYLTDLVRPGDRPLPSEVVAAIREFGLEADLARPVEDLPYGRRRLLAIARAVATAPAFLLLDEPAAGLSDDETAELAHLVRRLADDWGIGVLLVEHDMRFVMDVCDNIVVLQFGEVISEGPPDVVSADPVVISAYLGEPEVPEALEIP